MRIAFLALGAKVATTFAQFGATALVLMKLSIDDQGFYYTFAALVATQTLFELGLGQVLVVYLAHECRAVNYSDICSARPNHRARIITRSSMYQYTRLSAIYLISIGSIGCLLVLVAGASSAAASVNWLLPWLAIIAASSLRLPLIWLESILEGIGALPYVLAIRIIANFLWLATFWIAIQCEFALFSLAIATFTLVAWSLMAYLPYRHLLGRFSRPLPQGAPKMDWKRETRVMQQRVSGTWVASYLITNAPIPLALTLLGPKEAGQLGVAFQFAAAIGVVASAFTAPLMSQASKLIANTAVQPFCSLLRSTFFRTLVVGFLVAFVGLFVLMVAPIIRPQLEQRLPPLLIAAPLLGAAIVNCALSCVAVFARAKKVELFTLPLFAVAGVTIVGTLLANGAGGLGTISTLHFIAAILITTPAVWINLRKLLHQESTIYP